MIKADTVTEYLLAGQETKRLAKRLKELKAREDQLELEMIAALEGKQRVEPSCGWKLAVEKYEKKYCPSYKACAIEFATELDVIKWVDEHNPHEEAKRLVVEMKPQKLAVA